MLIMLLGFCLETFLFYLFFSHCYHSHVKRKSDEEYKKELLIRLQGVCFGNDLYFCELNEKLEELVSIQKENQRLKQKIKKLEKEKENGNS